VNALALSLAVNVTVLDRPAHLSVPQLVSLLVVAVAAVRMAFRALPRSGANGVWAWSGLIFAVAALPSLVATDFPGAAAVGTAQLVLVGLVIFAATKLLEAYPESLESTLGVLAVAAVVSVIPALVQTALGVGPESFVRYGIMRAYSTFGQPNSYGLYLAGMVPLFFGLTAYRRAFAIPFVLTAVALAATLSRGAMAGAGVAIVGFLLAHRRSARARGMGAVVVGSLALASLVVLALPESIFTGLTSFGDWSSQQRALTLVTSVTAIRARPFLGYGPGSFAALRPDIAVSGLVDDIDMPHNFVIEVWLELGIVALGCFLVLVAAYYVTTQRAYRRVGDPVLGALVAAFTGMLVTSLTASLLIRGIEELFALLIALTAARLISLRQMPSHAHPVPV
jgi:O-antigen ligase